MPANEIMRLYRAGELHSGSTGKVVRKESQAKAILMQYLRKDGRPIPAAQER
jgi:hypothetical protein